jgi:regulatory protein
MDTPPGRKPSRPRRDIPAGKPPDAARLREAALAHLARFGTTEAGLRRVLERRVDRWARRAGDEGQLAELVAPQVALGKQAAAEVARALAGVGAVDDAAFAAARTKRLAQSGRSRRAIAAHLAAKGVDGSTAGALLEEVDELTAALGHLKRRRAGPFAPEHPPAPEARLKALAALARAGFSRDLAERALDLDPEDATGRLLAARRG